MFKISPLADFFWHRLGRRKIPWIAGWDVGRSLVVLTLGRWKILLQCQLGQRKIYLRRQEGDLLFLMAQPMEDSLSASTETDQTQRNLRRCKKFWGVDWDVGISLGASTKTSEKIKISNNSAQDDIYA